MDIKEQVLKVMKEAGKNLSVQEKWKTIRIRPKKTLTKLFKL